MILRFTNPDYTLKQDWSFADVNKTTTTFTSRDGRFILDTSKAKNKSTEVVVYNTPGYPGTITGTVIVGPYTVGTNGTGIIGNVSVSLRMESGTQTGTVMAWDGKSWKALVSKSADGLLTVTGPLMPVYVVVAK
jgi:hypothetical protein